MRGGGGRGHIREIRVNVPSTDENPASKDLTRTSYIKKDPKIKMMRSIAIQDDIRRKSFH